MIDYLQIYLQVVGLLTFQFPADSRCHPEVSLEVIQHTLEGPKPGTFAVFHLVVFEIHLSLLEELHLKNTRSFPWRDIWLPSKKYLLVIIIH